MLLAAAESKTEGQSDLATEPVLKTGEPDGLGGSTPSLSACIGGRSLQVAVTHLPVINKKGGPGGWFDSFVPHTGMTIGP